MKRHIKGRNVKQERGGGGAQTAGSQRKECKRPNTSRGCAEHAPVCLRGFVACILFVCVWVCVHACVCAR